MTLDQKQQVEREKLQRLLYSMETRAHDLPSLMKVLSACEGIGELDPLPHLKAAMKNYLKSSNSVHELPQKES